MSAETDLFTAALGLASPWEVDGVDFDLEISELNLNVTFKSGSRFACPVCGSLVPAYDTTQRRWRHLNFFQHKAFLNAPLPRVNCDKCGIKTITAPWAAPGGGFTLLFMAFAVTLAKCMPVSAVARLLGEHDTRIWRLLSRLVEKARTEQDMSLVKNIGVDETSNKRGHDYVTVFADMGEKRVLFVADGKGADTVTAFREELVSHKGAAENIELVCMDMSAAFQSGVATEFPTTEIVFDRFHVTALVNDAVDLIRRAEVRENELLKKTRYIWLKNPANLTDKQQETLAMLNTMNIGTAKAYQMKLNLQDLWEQPDREAAEAHLNAWYTWVTTSDIGAPMKRAAMTIKGYASRILNYYVQRLTNGYMEGLNSLIQAAKAKARGYRNVKNMKTIIYLMLGKLNFQLPT